MKKSAKILFVALLELLIFPLDAFAVTVKTPATKTAAEPSTRNNAVIFKVHDISPISDEGVVTGCDFTVTLYNRTSINFRSFTLNLQWKDVVDERFKFERYVESILGADEAIKQKAFLGEKGVSKPLQAGVTVNAFGADKQISIRSHVDNEKCYLMLSDAEFNVTPCDIVRSIDTANTLGIDIESKDCTGLFQLVDTSNPEYFGKFKKISATEFAAQEQQMQNRELSDIDVIISKIVENLGASDSTLTNIN